MFNCFGTIAAKGINVELPIVAAAAAAVSCGAECRHAGGDVVVEQPWEYHCLFWVSVVNGFFFDVRVELLYFAVAMYKLFGLYGLELVALTVELRP